METVYAVLLLHKAGKEINEENIKKIIEAAGLEVDETKIKSLITSLKGVDIEKELENATISAPATKQVAEKQEEKEEKKQSEAAEGLASLFA